MRPTTAEVDLEAIRANARTLTELVHPASLLAVVKADAYGHGAVPVARALVDEGADQLGVATVEEAIELREAGINLPILLLSEPPIDAAGEVVARRLTPTVYTTPLIEALASTAREADAVVGVHLKVDTGMARVGAHPDVAVATAQLLHDAAGLDLVAVWTHLAVADDPDDPFTGEQLAAFQKVLGELEDVGLRPPIAHAANSAGAIAHPDARLDLVRCGIAVYGLPPSLAVGALVELQPALRLVSQVSYAKPVPAGTGVSYGLRYETDRATTLATVPIGYADGVPRALPLRGGEVLIRGRRRPMAGVVTMDQLVVDCGDDDVEHGDEVVLIGRQGGDEVTATEWAELTDTINYEIVCGIGARVPRTYR